MLRTDAQLADMLGMAESNLNRKKKQGKLSNLIIEWGEFRSDIDLNVIFYGKPRSQMENEPDQGQAVRMLLDIFESSDQKAKEAIYKNLEYFSGAVAKSKTDRRKVIDQNWPQEKERRKAGGPSAQPG